MTFDTYGDPIDTSRPVELYTIVQGALTYEYTSAEDDLTVASIPYTAEKISRGKIGQSPQDRNRTIEIRVPVGNAFAKRYKLSTPGSRAQITIQRFQRPDSPGFATITLFIGFVQSVSFENEMKQAVILCSPIETASTRPIPRFSYQSLCNHVLFDSGCKVDDTDSRFRFSHTVSAQSGSSITVPGADGYGANFFTGGFLEIDGGDDSRLIVASSGATLQLLLPFPSSAVGRTVTIFAGCDHTVATCDTKFDTPEDTLSNVINFGGFAFVPNRNPYQTGIQ